MDRDWKDEEFDLDYDEIDEHDFERDLVPCPACGAKVFDDAPECPACGQYITHSTSPWADRPWWWIVLGAAGIVAVIWLMLGI